MSELQLRRLSVSDGKDIFEMLQRIGADEWAFHNEVNGMTYSEYRNWLVEQSHWAEGEMLPSGYVRQWTYWLYDGGHPVGYGKLREKVTDESRKFGGNIGFAIDPLYRGKGYGTVLFQSLIEIGWNKQLSELFSTVEKFNYPSKAIHEKAGGQLVDENEKRWFFSFESFQGGR